MSTADQTVERAAAKLQKLANRLAAEGGTRAKIADSLAEDADLIRKMKPSLIKGRAKGEAPTGQMPAATTIPPSAPQESTSTQSKESGGGPNPWLVVGIALAAGIVLARFIDWRGHGYPRD